MVDQAGAAFGAISPLTALAGVAVCFLGGMIGGLSGYGAGMLVALFITPILGPKALIPVISVLMLINNASRVFFYREAVQPKLALRIAAVAIPAAWIGAELYVRLDSAAVQALLGVVLIASVPLRRWVAKRELRPSPVAVYGIGAAFGFLSSIIVGAGMLIVPTLMGIGLAGPALLATDAAIAVLVNLAKALIFGALDALDLRMALLAILMGLCTVPGTAAAAFIVRRTSLRLHTALIEALLVVGGAAMIWRSGLALA
jgi:uncharacterized membrane protein YfcA